jgi:carotenoid cleavage dioxygenase
MVHDFVITATKVVLVVSPAVFELERLLRGEGSPLDWRPELGTRIAVIDRAGAAPTRWYQTDSFWSWHFGNGFDDGDDVVFDGVRWDHLGIDLAGDNGANAGDYTRFRLRPGTTTVHTETVVDRQMEFPRIDDRLIGRRHGQVAVGTRTGRDIPVGQFDALLTLDPDTGSTALYDAGDLAVGEPCFAGDHLLTFAIDRTSYDSYLLILRADDVAAGPVAQITIGSRVPLGLHGAWLPD